MYDSTHVITKNAAISRCRYGDGDIRLYVHLKF